jgi:hypothetical protein
MERSMTVTWSIPADVGESVEPVSFARRGRAGKRGLFVPAVGPPGVTVAVEGCTDGDVVMARGGGGRGGGEGEAFPNRACC